MIAIHPQVLMLKVLLAGLTVDTVRDMTTRCFVPSPAKRPECGDCAYWDEGCCHRYGPTGYGWPRTAAEDWCGDFKRDHRLAR